MRCRPFQGSIQPKAVYRSVPKLVPACSSGQLRSRRQRKDSPTHAAAAEPGAVYYANEDKEKLAPNMANTYNVQSPQDNAVKAWLLLIHIPSHSFYIMYVFS